MSESKIVMFAGESAAMQAAAEQAQSTFKYFWRELSWEYRRIIPGLGLAAVKVAFPCDSEGDEPGVEHMWVNDIQFDGQTISGTLLNSPQWCDNIAAGDPVSVTLADIGDWMYTIAGKVYGGFSIDVMRQDMSDSERADHDQAWGLDFGKPGEVLIVPAQQPEKKGFLSGLLSKKEPVAVVNTGDLPEHPMSENMVEKMDEGLRDDPSFARSVDENGWTLLQKDALAGNLAPVTLLVKHGAELDAVNPMGETALDLARKIGWPRIVAFLEKKLH
ncbi:DUF2314 domain-containing protein [Undibacterium pigrum]|uniref:Uncharacterized protein YegJ (DUF2314 family) n=1 Tax=Undibacterium pigrum TaxID=401470 RepID=A0A318J9K6_9BURK|nr:DUF2314 domain-containing protein [Undibacterium pigrum]PXX44818.1 uncharacterized protein YegJ (DUF2314 family) [Undibacterium pigrum]